MVIKRCYVCEEVFTSAVYFTRDKSRKDGLSNICRACEKHKNHKYHQGQKVK